jgi:hypothetical protein
MTWWTVILEKPGREDRRVQVGQLAPTLELPVDRLSFSDGFGSWRPLPTYDRGIFIETYILTAMNPDTKTAWAEFRKLRRSHELARHFDPARLPL